jgi:LysR family transcriptional regulator, carnitine catabolism transcriptional activator
MMVSTMRTGLKLHQLEAFQEVARSGGFSGAARTLNISQPALSRTIRQIEETLGVRLFDRSTRNVRLTPAGDKLLAGARRVINEVDNAVADFSDFVEGRRGRIAVAALPSVAAWILPRAIARYRECHPNVDVIVLDGLAEKVADAVLDGTAEFGVTMQPARTGDLHYEPLLSDDFALVCRADDPLARRKSVAWSVFRDRPFVAMSRNSSVRALTDSAFLQAGFATRPLYECAHLATAGGLVAAGLGITALPRLTLPIIQFSGLVHRPLHAPRISRAIGVISRGGRTLSPAAAAFLDALRQSRAGRDAQLKLLLR